MASYIEKTLTKKCSCDEIRNKMPRKLIMKYKLWDFDRK